MPIADYIKAGIIRLLRPNFSHLILQPEWLWWVELRRWIGQFNMNGWWFPSECVAGLERNTQGV